MLHSFSVDHKHAPLSVRETLAMTECQQVDWLADQQQTAVLSTCNRFELITYSPSADAHAMWRELAGPQAAPHTVIYTGSNAAEHLFRVAAGLESAILGEPEILGQVTAAYERALEAGSAGSYLSELFLAAIHAAKRVRTETALAEGTVSFISMGLRLVEQVLGDLTHQPILVIGAGEMGSSVLKALKSRGMTDVTLSSRTFSKAEALASRWGAKVVPIEQMHDQMRASTLVFCASSAPHSIMTPFHLEDARPERIVFIDLALPRDVDPAVALLPGVCVYDLEELRIQAESALDDRRRALPDAETVLDEELAGFWRRFQARAAAPTIRAMREQVESIRQAELARIRHRIQMADDPAAVVEEFSYRLMNKILHQPTIALRERAARDEAFQMMTRDLFGLDAHD